MDFDDLDEIEEAEAAKAAAAEAEKKAAAEKAAAEESAKRKAAIEKAKAEAAAKEADEKAAAEKAAAKATPNGTSAASTTNGHSGGSTSKSGGTLDFDELDELESAKAEAADGRGDRPLWTPIPDAVWKTLPPFHPKQRPLNMKDFKAVVNESAPGDYWGIEFPYTPKMLREMGPKWLTKAMHLTGCLPKDNEVTKFVSMDVKAEDVTMQDAENAKWGGAGLKVLLQVEYKNGPGDLTTGMFIKMPHEFNGKNERFKNSVTSYGMDWSEVTWYNIFGGRFGDLPFKSPRMYFCDISRKTTNFVNIVEMIPYGKSGVDVGPGQYFPAPEKYKDWALPNKGVEHYYCHARTLAQFFGWHRQMREKTDQVEKLFMDPQRQQFIDGIHKVVSGGGPYNSAGRDKVYAQMLKDPMVQGAMGTLSFPPQAAQGFLEMCENFVKNTTRHMYPKEYMTEANLGKFFKEATEMSKYCCEMALYQQSIPEYFSLVHPNAQVDNAFYWKDQAGNMKCGLLDWGGVSHNTIPDCIGNGWMGAEPDVLDEHEEKYLMCFIDEFEKVCGFRFDFDNLYMHMKLAQATVLFGCCANIGRVLRTIPKDDWKNIKSRKDPQINDNFLMRCYFVQIEMYLGMWRKRSPYAHYQKWRKRVGIPDK